MLSNFSLFHQLSFHLELSSLKLKVSHYHCQSVMLAASIASWSLKQIFNNLHICLSIPKYFNLAPAKCKAFQRMIIDIYMDLIIATFNASFPF